MPDGSRYTIGYEPTPGAPTSTTGRIASISLPSGGTITYSYTGANNGIICADGSPAGLVRTTPDGTWTYTRAVTQDRPFMQVGPWVVTSSITTVTDPLGNVTVTNFGTDDRYESKRQVYSGSSTLLETIETCYGGAAFPCTNAPAGPPMTRKTVRREFPDTSGMVSQTDTFYDTNSLVTDVYEYDFGAAGPGALISHTVNTYASLTANLFYDPNNPSTSYQVSIYDRPATVTVKDGGGAIKSQSTYSYDETAVTPIAGTPQHVAVSGSRGNVTTMKYLVQGTSTVQRTKSYFDTGGINTETDLNGNPTSYTYGTGSCGNSFPIKVTDAKGFNTLMSWDCNGGMATAGTDRNGQTTSYLYGDPNFWRLTQTNYPDDKLLLRIIWEQPHPGTSFRPKQSAERKRLRVRRSTTAWGVSLRLSSIPIQTARAGTRPTGPTTAAAALTVSPILTVQPASPPTA